MQFAVTLSSDFLTKSYAKRTFRHWPRLFLAVALVLGGVFLNFRHGIGSISEIGLTAIGFAILIYAVTWIRQTRAIKKFIKQQGECPLTYTLTDREVSATSVLGSTTLVWTAFEKLVISDLDTLLFFSSSSALTLPTSQLSSEILDYICQKFKASEKRVIDKRKRG
jgi:hypothetical protein